MAGVSTMYAPSTYPVQDSLRLFNFAGMWNLLSGDKGSSDSRVGFKPDDLTTPTTPSHAPISPPTATHPTSNAPEHPPLGEDGEVLNGASVSCTTCHKKFANIHRLQRHMISHNESDNLRRFKCDECGKAFKFKHHLKEHKRIHSGEKPFECEHCGKRFSHSGSYSSHMSSKKCQLGRTRGNAAFINRTSPQYPPSGAKRQPPGAPYLPILPKGDSPTSSDLGYSSPTRPISQDTILMSPPSLVSPGGLPSSIHQGFSASLQPNLHSSFSPALSSYHPFNSLILAAQLQPQYTLLSLLSKNEREGDVREKRELLKEDAEDEDREPGELVIKEDGQDEDEKEVMRSREEAIRGSGISSVQHVIDVVNSSVTKMKFDEVVSQASPNSLADDLSCQLCGARFSGRFDAIQHSRFHCPRLADVSAARESYRGQLIEGLAARLYKEVGSRHATAAALHDSAINRGQYLQQPHPPQFPPPYREEEPGHDFDYSRIVDDEEMTSDGKKVRVRSHIREDQLAILRAHYSVNPRPKKDELQAIASKVDFPVRVVQVWFQNARARDRREGRCLTPTSLPFLPPPMPVLSCPPSSYASVTSICTPAPSPGLITSSSLTGTTKAFVSPYYPSLVASHTRFNTAVGEEYASEMRTSDRSGVVDPGDDEDDDPKPLDLSTRKTSTSSSSSCVASSPKPVSVVSDSDNESMSLAVSYKSESRTPTPTPFNNNVSESKDSLGASKLAQILSGHPYDYGEKRPREEEGSGDEMRKRRKDDEGGIFQCDQCDKSFNKQSSLTRHKYEHSGMRPHKCELCPKAFKHKHHLTEHSRLHTGEKPYQCHKCLKRFSHSGSYSQHMNHRFSYCKPYNQQADSFISRLSNASTPASSPGGELPQEPGSHPSSPNGYGMSAKDPFPPREAHTPPSLESHLERATPCKESCDEDSEHPSPSCEESTFSLASSEGRSSEEVKDDRRERPSQIILNESRENSA